jgi:hypothetical protein
VAAFAFYDKLKHQLSQCQCYRKTQMLHPLSGGVANRLPLRSAQRIKCADNTISHPALYRKRSSFIF